MSTDDQGPHISVDNVSVHYAVTRKGLIKMNQQLDPDDLSLTARIVNRIVCKLQGHIPYKGRCLSCKRRVGNSRAGYDLDNDRDQLQPRD